MSFGALRSSLMPGLPTNFLLLVVFVSFPYIDARVLFNDSTETGLEELERCVAAIVKKNAKRRKLVFLADEVKEAGGLGDRLVQLLQKDRAIFGLNTKRSYQGLFIFIVDSNRLFDGNRKSKYNDIASKINVANGRSKLLFIWRKTKSNVLKDVRHVFEELWTQQIIDVVAVVLGSYRAIRLYTYNPFTTRHCFEAGPPVLINDWDSRRGRFTNKLALYSKRSKVGNLFGCKLRCMGVHRPPEAVIERVDNSWRLSGTGIEMFNFMASYLNFTPEIVINRPRNVQERERLNETSCLMSMVATREVDMGFGKFTRLLDNEAGVTFAKEIQQDCFTWGVPEGIGHEPSIWKYYTTEFTIPTWCMVAASFVITIFFLKYFSKYLRKERPKFRQLSYTVYFTYATFVGATIKPKPTTFPLRVFVSNWLIFALVITSAYVAYLGSLVTVPAPEPELENQEDLLATSLNIGGRQQMFYILNSSAQSSVDIEQLILRYQILSPLPFYHHVSRVITRRDLAVFASKRELLHYSDHFRYETNSSRKMFVLPVCVTRSYSSPFIFRTGSPFLTPVNNVLWRLYETGITLKWDTINKDQELSQERVFTKETVLTLRHLYGAYVILLAGYVFAALVFAVELLCGRSSDLSRDLTQNVKMPKNETIFPFVN